MPPSVVNLERLSIKQAQALSQGAPAHDTTAFASRMPLSLLVFHAGQLEIGMPRKSCAQGQAFRLDIPLALGHMGSGQKLGGLKRLKE